MKSTKPFFDEFLSGVSKKDLPRAKRWLRLLKQKGEAAPDFSYRRKLGSPLPHQGLASAVSIECQYFADENNNLLRDNPAQRALDLREVPKPATPELKEPIKLQAAN